MLSEILEHRVLPDAIPQSEGTYVNAYYGRVKRRKATTCGWDILVEERKDGSSDWIALKDLKDSYPVERALYTTNQNLDDEAVLTWWVPSVLKKKLRILKKVQSKYSSRINMAYAYQKHQRSHDNRQRTWRHALDGCHLTQDTKCMSSIRGIWWTPKWINGLLI